MDILESFLDWQGNAARANEKNIQLHHDNGPIADILSSQAEFTAYDIVAKHIRSDGLHVTEDMITSVIEARAIAQAEITNGHRGNIVGQPDYFGQTLESTLQTIINEIEQLPEIRARLHLV